MPGTCEKLGAPTFLEQLAMMDQDMDLSIVYFLKVIEKLRTENTALKDENSMLKSLLQKTNL